MTKLLSKTVSLNPLGTKRASQVTRDWKQFHTLKNLSSALSVEAAELLEITQWKNPQELELDAESVRTSVSKEVADVFIYVLLICEIFGIDLVQVTEEKIAENAVKYPVDKSRGSARKYSEL